MAGEMYITIIDDLEGYKKRFEHSDYAKTRKAPIIIHYGLTWHFSRCKDRKELDHLCNKLGIEYSFHTEQDGLKTYLTKTKYESKLFWSLDEIPLEAKPTKALGNGDIVDCFFVNKNDVLTIYRPNPNAKEIYHPLSLEEHLRYQENNPVF